MTFSFTSTTTTAETYEQTEGEVNTGGASVTVSASFELEANMIFARQKTTLGVSATGSWERSKSTDTTVGNTKETAKEWSM